MRVLPIVTIACWQLLFVSISLAIEPDVSRLRDLTFIDVAAKKIRDVKIIELEGKKYWVSAYAIPKLPFDNKIYATKKLSLLMRASIANAVNRGRSNSGISISEFHLNAIWEENNWWHGIGHVLEKNVTILNANQSQQTHAKDDDTKAALTLNTNNLTEEIDVEINSLVAAIKKSPDSVNALEVLYAFYLAKRDVENASMIMDQIMKINYKND